MLTSQGLRATAISSALHPSCLRILRAPPFCPFRAQTQFNQYRRFGSRYQRFQQTRNFLYRWSQRPTFYYEVAGLGGVVGGFYISNLETVPVSGRRRFNIISPKTEEELGKQQYQQILAQYRGQLVSDWDPRVRMVRRVMDRLIPVSGLPYQEWEIHVIESQERNAFVLPGGKVFVFTNILPICKNDDGVATVLGHEIAHNVAHHAAEKMSSFYVLTSVVILLAALVGVDERFSRILLQLGFEMPNGRKQETEADFIGLQMMAEACYNPEEAVLFWDRMEKAAEYEPPQMLSTHPSSHNRQEKLKEWLPQADDKRQQSDCAPMLGLGHDFKRAFQQLKG